MSRRGAMEIKLKGKTAAIALPVIVVLVVGWGYYNLNRMRGASDQLKERFQTEFEMEQIRNVGVENALEAPKIEITDVGIRGGLSKRGAIVRVEFTLDGKPPVGGDGVRYYRMRYSSLTGWRHDTLWPLSETSWNLAFPR